MKKFGFLLSLLLIIEISKEIEIGPEIMETIYDKIALITKGMNSTSEQKCYNCLIKEENKKFILNTIMQIISEIQTNPEDQIAIIIKYVLPLIGNPQLNLEENCHISKLWEFYVNLQDFNSRVKIVDKVGESIQENVDKFYKGTSQLVKTRGIDGKIVLLGNIVSATLNITL